MLRIILKSTGNNEPLPPHEQSILNSLVYCRLCDCEIFSIIHKVGEEQRETALKLALDWCINHGLVDDEQG